ncbi:TULIP family P47-like protein [Streptomyces griseoruber]|uniref:TULIP family P47-like protein n=1 Tax=Streptomyces griseoruber TaxID=1943 RepID=UPI003792503D
MKPQLVTQDGQQYLLYTGTELSKQTSYKVAPWVQLTEAIVELVLGVCTLGAGAVADSVMEGMAYIVVGLVTMFVTKVIAMIPEWIAGKVPDNLPSIDSLLSAASTPLQWKDAKEFVPAEVQFDGGLQMSGNCFV